MTLSSDSPHSTSNIRSSWVPKGIPTPGLALNIAIFDANMAEIVHVAKSHGVELYPHAKTHRTPAIGLRQIAAGADGLCVAKLGEAEAFVDAGVEKVFIAFPLVGHDKGERALELSRRAEVIGATDSVVGAQTIGAVFARSGESFPVMLAIDTGLAREGVAPEEAAAVAERISEIDGIELVGIYTHEGTTYEATNRGDLEKRAFDAAELMVRTAEKIRRRGIALPHVSMGASASARVVAGIPGVTQIRPGILAFNDVGQIALGNASLDSAAVRVVATVISNTDTHRACIDAGSKSLGTDLVPASAHRAEYPGMGLITNAPGWIVERMSEEHGWLAWIGEGEPRGIEVGSRLEIIPNHICMAFGMLRRSYVVENDRIIDVWDAAGAGTSE